MHKHLLAFVFCLGVANGVTAGESPAVGSPLVTRLEAEYQIKPNDIEVLHALARALMQQVRTSPDARVAARADSLISRAQTLAPKHAQTWALKAWSQMSRHQFSAALVSAREAQRLEAGEPLSLGLLADALVELGQYEQAVEVVQVMVDKAPGLPSYSRAAHLRFLHGDTVGAIELMAQAARSAQSQSEEAVWVQMQLAELYLQAGKTEDAEQIAADSLAVRPGWHPALAQLAKVRVAQGRREHALSLYQQAAARQPNPEYILAIWKLADRLGNTREAKRAEKLLNAMALLDEKNGGLSRRVFVDFLSHNPRRITDAEKLARSDLDSRPDIYGEDALAWTLHLGGKNAEAAQHMARALRLKTQDVTLSEHATAIGAEKITLTMQEAP